MEAEPQYIENEYHIVRLSNDQVIHPQSPVKFIVLIILGYI